MQRTEIAVPLALQVEPSTDSWDNVQAAQRGVKLVFSIASAVHPWRERGGGRRLWRPNSLAFHSSERCRTGMWDGDGRWLLFCPSFVKCSSAEGFEK